MTTPAKLNKQRNPPYLLAGIIFLLIGALITGLVYVQFRGGFQRVTQLTMLASRAGLVMEPGTPVTFNGVHVGRVTHIEETQRDGQPAAKFTLDIDDKYIPVIPANADAQILATTLFGNKFVAFSSPKDPSPQHINPSVPIDVTSVTTEFNTLFETVVSISEQVDPIKLNQTLSATAQALDGLGDRFGQSIVHGNEILADLNPKMPQIARDNKLLADLGEVYANASPDLFEGLNNAVTTARTLNQEQGNIDQALMAAVGFGNNGGDVFERGGPYLVRGAEDLLPTSQTLDDYSPALFCTIRNFHDVEPKVAASLGGNGYSLRTLSSPMGAGNPYVYPDNLPRVNARGGPEGKPGCWQPITRDLWPAPYLVMDNGASIAPYNHFGLGQPILNEYVWGRQIGEYSINP